jgi:hypothetical protein
MSIENTLHAGALTLFAVLCIAAASDGAREQAIAVAAQRFVPTTAGPASAATRVAHAPAALPR